MHASILYNLIELIHRYLILPIELLIDYILTLISIPF